VADIEDFTLKSIYSDSVVNSPCIGKSDTTTFPDIGAYDIDRSILSDSWDKYVLVHAPLTMNDELEVKGATFFEDVLGNLSNWGKSDKIILPFQWASDSMTVDVQRKKIRYFSSLIPTRENGRTDSQCEFRIKLAPTTYNGTGTSATISSTAKTITDTVADLVENEKKGWHVSIKFDSGSGTGGVTASTKKIQVSPSPTWTIDGWIGYYCYYNGYYYYITDNDADELTLSDPNETLSDASNVTWARTKSFKIASNTNTVLTLIDDDSELVSGTYDYFIDYVLCKLMSAGHSYTQKVYSYDEASNNKKSGYSMVWQEVE
jgi:hypothetical protein